MQARPFSTHTTQSLSFSNPQIIDGRYHSECGHFYSMSTRLQDCGQERCVFSSHHIHPTGCRHASCTRSMGLPVRNPIRMSPTICPDCRQGSLGVQRVGLSA